MSEAYEIGRHVRRLPEPPHMTPPPTDRAALEGTIDLKRQRLDARAPEILKASERLARMCVQDTRYLHDAEFHAATKTVLILSRFVEEGR